MRTETQDYLKLHFIVLVWGFTAILGALMTIPAVEIVFFRTLLAAAALLALLYYRKLPLRIGRRGVWQTLGTGALIAGHWILFFGAARVATVSVCLAGMATVTVWTSVLEPIMIGRRFRWFELALGLVVIGGLYVIFRFEFDHVVGLLMALGSALLGAIFSILNVRFARDYHPLTVTFYEMTGACLAVVAFFPFYQHFFLAGAPLSLWPSLADWGWLLVLSLVCTVYAFSASVELMKRITAFAMNLTVNLEPVYGIVLAFLVFGEREKMHPGFYVGTLIILSAVVAYPVGNRLQRYRRARQTARAAALVHGGAPEEAGVKID